MPQNIIIFLVIFSLAISQFKCNNSHNISSLIDISFSTQIYDHMKVLVEPDFSILYWTHNITDIIFEIHVRTNDWIGFGLSPNGSIENSDIIIAWLNDHGTGHFSDRHIRNQKLIIDQEPNWNLLYSTRINSITIFKFTRKIYLCENLEDLDIFKEGSYVLFTWGDLNKEISIDNKNTKLIFLNLSNVTKNCEKKFEEEKFESSPKEIYENFIELEKNVYRFYWNLTNDFLIAEIHVKTLGWIGFGLSPDGKVRDSDLFIGWIKDGSVFFSDRYVYGKRSINDLNNDIELLNASEIDGYTIFKIKRPLILCDPDDRSIESGTPFVIHPWHPEDPNDSYEISLNDNSNRSTQINFYKKNSSKIDTDNEKIFFDIQLVNKIIPIRYNQYCKIYEIPRNITKKHIYKWQIKLPKINSDSLINIRFYECDLNYKPLNLYDDGHCDMNINTTHCTLSSIGWSQGSDLTVFFPDDLGYPIGGDTDYRHLILNLDFDHPEDSSKFIDNLLIRFYMTDNLREHELGSVTLGTETDPLGILIPPGVERFPITTYCFNTCIRKKFDYVTFAMASPQTHSAGRQVWTKIVRNQTEIGYLHLNKFYNYKYQNFYEINPRVTVTKDDSLITQCIYSTKNRNYLTKGGIGLNEETCLYSYFYYPRVKTFKTCKSLPTFTEQINVFKKLKKNDLINFSDSDNDSNLSILYAAYKSLDKVDNFSDYLVQNIYSIYSSSNFYAHCDGSFNFDPHEKIVVKKIFKEIDKCDVLMERSKILSIYQLKSKSTDIKRFNYLNYYFILKIFLLLKFLSCF